MTDKYFDYEKIMIKIDLYMQKYEFISVTGMGNSILGRSIPVIAFGEGKSTVVYLGGEAGDDYISVTMLLRFVKDICELYKSGGSAFGFSAENIFKNYNIVVIPLLNPDGISYCARGIGEDNPLRERILNMNGGRLDNASFSAWKGNARGVDLRYNYGAENSEREPEAEVGSLCNFLRFGFTPEMLFSFSRADTNEGMIFFGEGARDNKIAMALTQMSGLKRRFRESKEPCLMLSDWAKRELSAAAFSIELPYINGFSKKNFEDKLFACYASMRKLLFCAPFLNKI